MGKFKGNASPFLWKNHYPLWATSPLESKFWEPLLVLKKMIGHTLQRGEGETMVIKQWNENSIAR